MTRRRKSIQVTDRGDGGKLTNIITLRYIFTSRAFVVFVFHTTSNIFVTAGVR